MKYKIKPKKYYVTATDKFVTYLSGLGGKPKIDKIIIVCNDFDEAMDVEDILLSRKGYSHVRKSAKKPSFPSAKYRVVVYEAKQWKKR